jgi:hypothetical protein
MPSEAQSRSGLIVSLSYELGVDEIHRTELPSREALRFQKILVQDRPELSESGQIVGDVPRGAAEPLRQAVDHETNVEDVNFLRQNMIHKPAGKIHNPVIRQ